MSESLTLIERRIYNYLIDYLKRETFQPSIREIGSRFGIRSTKTVTEHLAALQRKGYLDRAPSRSRALRIHGLDLSPDTYTIPVYRNGRRDEADLEGRYDLDRAFACSADCYMVYVDLESRELGVLARDLVLVDPDAEPEPGNLLVYERAGRIAVGLAGEAGWAGDGASRPADNGSPKSRLLGVGRTVLRSLPRSREGARAEA